MSKKYENNERSLKSLKRRQVAICKGIEQMNTAMGIAQSVVETMSGKVLNKRLSTAIQTAIDAGMGERKVSVSLEYEYSGKCTIVFYLFERSYQDSEPDANGCCTCSYFDSEVYGHVYTDAIGTIEAEKINTALQGAINYNKRTAYKYTDAVKHFSKYLTKYEKALEQLRKIYSTINPLLVDSSLSSYDLTRGYSYPKLSQWEEEREKALNL